MSAINVFAMYLIGKGIACLFVVGVLMVIAIVLFGQSYVWSQFLQVTFAFWVFSILFDLYFINKTKEL